MKRSAGARDLTRRRVRRILPVLYGEADFAKNLCSSAFVRNGHEIARLSVETCFFKIEKKLRFPDSLHVGGCFQS